MSSGATIVVFFDIPDRRLTLMMEVEAATYDAYKTMDRLNDNFGCDVRPIVRKEYNRLTKLYMGQ